jgi:chromosome segregation ATPase
MGKSVIDSISVNKTMGVVTGMSSYSTTVPDYDDLREKADSKNVDKKIEIVVSKIETEGNNRKELEQKLVSFNNALTSKIDKNLLEKMKSEILSNDRLTKEQNTLQSLFQLLIDRMHKESAAEYDKIKKEIDAFKSIDLNKELQVKLAPLDQNLKTLIAKTNATFESLQKVAPLTDTLAANADFQRRLASAKTEINTLVNKYAEERRNLQSNIQNIENGLDRLTFELNRLEERQKSILWDVNIGLIILVIIGGLGIASFFGFINL